MKHKILLPKEIIDYIWSYDDRYKIQFKYCVDEMRRYFYVNRLRCHMSMNRHIYCVYEHLLSYHIWKKSFSQHLLERIRTHGCRVILDNLICHNLKNIS
jgi:hypothetical protein